MAVLHVELRREKRREHAIQLFTLCRRHVLDREILREDLVDVRAQLLSLPGGQQPCEPEIGRPLARPRQQVIGT